MSKKITCNTKPLVDSLALGIISANISKHYKLSTMIQLTGKKNLLTMNTAAANILSEMKVRGMSKEIEDDEAVIALVDADKFKSLVSTIDSNTVEIEFVDGGIILRSGSSKFVFPAYVDSSDYTLPSLEVADKNSKTIEIQVKNWKFIQDNQMYALAASYVHPVYNNVWISGDGRVLSGDFDISFFTCSAKGEDLLECCLLPDTIVNLLASVPEGGKIVKLDKGYQIQVTTDAFEYTSQFTPKYESDPDVGSYHADIILGQFKAENDEIEVSLPAIQKTLTQANIISDIEANSKIEMELKDNVLTLSNSEIKTPIKIKNKTEASWKSTFYFRQLAKAIGHHNEETIKIVPIINEESVDGLILYDLQMQTLIAGVEE